MIEITIQWRRISRSFLWLGVERVETEVGNYPVYQYCLLLLFLFQINFQYTSKKAEDSYILEDNPDIDEPLDDASAHRIYEALKQKFES